MSAANAVAVRSTVPLTLAPSQPLRSGAEKGASERGLSEPLFLYGEFRSALFCEHRKELLRSRSGGVGCAFFCLLFFAQAKKSESPTGETRIHHKPLTQQSALARFANAAAKQLATLAPPTLALPRKRERELITLATASTLLFSACIAQQPTTEPTPTPAQKQQEAAALYLDAVKGLLEKQQYLAAIAHIQEDRRQHGDSPQLRLYEADARRNLGQSQAAQKLYESLLQDPKTAGDAQHGLGRIAAPGNLSTAISHLQKAASLKPVDVDVRNDLGYALMQAGRYTEARTELATAVELAPDETKARNNLLILLMAQGDEASLARVLAAARPAVDTALLARLRQQAQSLKSRPRKP